jgi:hypothetical protein
LQRPFSYEMFLPSVWLFDGVKLNLKNMSVSLPSLPLAAVSEKEALLEGHISMWCLSFLLLSFLVVFQHST